MESLALEGLAEIALAQGATERRTRLLMAADALREIIDADLADLPFHA